MKRTSLPRVSQKVQIAKYTSKYASRAAIARRRRKKNISGSKTGDKIISRTVTGQFVFVFFTFDFRPSQMISPNPFTRPECSDGLADCRAVEAIRPACGKLLTR
jgi:hypothetical protein